MKGNREQITILWTVKLENNYDKEIQTAIRNDSIDHKVNALLPKVKIADIVTFIHISQTRKSKLTLVKVIENVKLTTFPMTKTAKVSKPLQKSENSTCIPSPKEKNTPQNIPK